MTNLVFKVDKKVLLLALSFLVIGLTGILLWMINDFKLSELAALSVTNRTINSYFGALITAMALIITLTSNLYSPRLAKVFVSHPLTVSGISYIVLTNLVIIISHIVPTTHFLFPVFSFISFSLVIIAIIGAIPFLFYVSKFVRPSYFIPLMSATALTRLKGLHSKKSDSLSRKSYGERYFTLIDDICNMATTAVRRGDRLVLHHVFTELFLHLKTMAKLKAHKNSNLIWRCTLSQYTLGMSEEGKYYLKKYDIWPEAYLLSKALDIAKMLNVTENELMPLICKELTNSNDISIMNEDSEVVKLHLRVLNSMLQNSLCNNNQDRFNSILYYYRINIELLLGEDELCDMAISYFVHYGRMAKDLDETKAVKSFIFSIGRIMNYLCIEDEKRANIFYEEVVKDVWSEFLNSKETFQLFTKKSIVKALWNVYSHNFSDLSTKIMHDFLADPIEHAILLKHILSHKDALDKEFSDELVNPEFLSGMARSLANDFYNDFKELPELNKKAS